MDDVLDVQEFDGCLVLTVCQASIFDQHTRALRNALHAALNATPSLPVVVDLRRVHYISSEGVGALISLHRLTLTQARKARLCGINQQVAGLLQLVKMVDRLEAGERGVMTASADVEAAVAALKS